MTGDFPIHELSDRLCELKLPLPDPELFAYLEAGKVMVVIETGKQRCLEIVDGETTTTRDLAERLTAPEEP